MADPVSDEVDEGVAVVTAVANAIDRPTAAALASCFRRLDADDSLRVAVLTGARGTFCAGADLKAMREGDEGGLEQYAIGGWRRGEARR